MSTIDNFFNANGSRFNAATDLLELHSFTIAAARAMTVEDALRKGHLHPSSLDDIPTSFSPHAAWGALLTRDIPEAPWRGVRVGQTALTDGAEKRRATKKVMPTHASMSALRAMLAQSSQSPKRYM